MNLVDTFQNRLKRAMELKNMKQVDLVEKTGLDKTLINKYFAGVSKARQKNLTILADILEVNEVWLMGYDVPIDRNFSNDSNILPLSDNIIKIPILGKISAGLPLYAEENLLGYDYIPASSVNINEEYFCLIVKGDSMNLKFNEGDRVLIRKQDTLESGFYSYVYFFDNTLT